MIRVMGVADEDVPHVVHVSVVGAVHADDGGLHHVSQGIDASGLV